MRSAQPSQQKLVDGRTVADRILARVRQVDPVWGTYALDLTFDALLEVGLATGCDHYRDYVLSVMDRRDARLEDDPQLEPRPFAQLAYSLYRCLGGTRLADVFVQESRVMRETVERSPDGLVLHRPSRGRSCVLVDFMQDYVARMARTGALTGEPEFMAEVGRQVRLHRELLRDPSSGLWRQGRGWTVDEPEALSPGAWSRGQGWVLRGLTDALEVMPAEQPSVRILQASLIELVNALLPRQAASGMWHCLVDRAGEDSAPETSGTALIAAALYRSLAAGHLEGETYRLAADRAWSALIERVDDEGRVTAVCAGPGPLNQELLEAYYLRRAFPEAEDHGWFSVLNACAAREAWLRVAQSGDCQPLSGRG